MRVYLRVVAMGFLQAKEFALNFIGEIIYLPLSLSLMYLLWNGIFSYGTDKAGISDMKLSDILLYYAVTNTIQFFTSMYWYLNYQIWQDINKGALAVYIARPIDYMWFTVSKYLANFLVRLGIGILTLFALFLNITNFYLMHLLFFIISLIEMTILLFTFQFLIGAISFWTESIFGIRDTIYTVVFFCGGLIVPLPMFPDKVQKILYYLPFRYLYDYPAQILLGKNFYNY